jgi:HD-GYP domain-containing protein (c-di-GMP phosphodiesterase class II)
VRRIGLAGLVFDLGMLLVPQRVRQGADQLNNADRERVHKHPFYSLSMLEKVDDCPPIVKLAALQHHEREDGSGYPRGRRKEMICDYARVLAVADAFAATMSPRSYRQQKLPYIAMEETLRLAAAMVFWTPACRALVQSAGLFPVGSGVKLSSGQLAHVIGSHAQMVDRPIVQPLDQQLRPVGKPIDLSQVPKEQLSVVRPVQISECTL